MPSSPRKPYKTLLERENLVKASDLKIVYEPWGTHLDLFHDHGEELLLSSPAGTGKSRAVLEKLHLVLSKYPNSKGFMARKTRSSMTNSCMDTFERYVLKPQDKVHLHKQDQHYNYPNGSILAIAGMDNPEKIKSTEWDIGYIQEATECSVNDWEMCTSRIRNFVVPYQQLIGDCNPDKPSHWLKNRCDKGLTKMLMSQHTDNPKLWDRHLQDWTPQGKVYIGKLDRLTGVRRSRLFLGLWVSAEGMVYEKWDPQVHMVSLSDMPQGWWDWDHYWAIDWGYIHPFAWGDFIENPETGQLYLLNQIYKTQTLVEDHAREIAKIVKGRVPRAVICDHDAGDRATFEKHISKHMNTPILTLPAYKSIGIGIQNVQNRLSIDPKWGDKPGFMIVRDSLKHNKDEMLLDAGDPTCVEDEFDGYVWDIIKNEDANSKKDEIPIDKDNHGMDLVRYMLAFADDLAIDPHNIEDTFFMNDEIENTISRY